MNHRHLAPNGGIGAFLRSRTGLVLIGFLAIAGFYLATEHMAHVYGILPYALILLCPIMHLFMHGSHGGHGGQDDHSAHANHAEHQAQRTEGDQS